MSSTRKTFLHQAAAAAAVGGAIGAVPASATAASRDHDHGHARPPLTRRELRALAAWCDHLAPGAAAAGVADFVADQLRKDPDDALLGLRYFDVPPPWPAFYSAGLGALERASATTFATDLAHLGAARTAQLHELLLTGATPWTGPASFFLFYLVTRSDAVDVVYGTPGGYARLDLRYAPLVRPPARW